MYLNPTFEFPIFKKTFKKTSNKLLSVFIFNQSIKVKNKPVIVFFHGGGFTKSNLTYTQFQHQAHYFSTIGFVAICAEYRTAYDDGFSPIHSIQDAKAAIRWVRQNHKKLGIDPNKIVVSGGSSGGYIALCCALIEKYNHATDNLKISCLPNAFVLFNPGVDFNPLKRLFPKLKENAKDISPIHQKSTGLPPSIIFHGTKDEHIPIQQIKNFCDQMIQNGNQIELIPIEGMGHGFFNYGAYENKPFFATNRYAESFLKKLGYF